jgi:hypothetical protein
MTAKQNFIALLKNYYKNYDEYKHIGQDSYSGSDIAKQLVALQNSLALVETSELPLDFIPYFDSQCQVLIALNRKLDAGFDRDKFKNPNMEIVHDVVNPVFFFLRNLLDKLENRF